MIESTREDIDLYYLTKYLIDVYHYQVSENDVKFVFYKNKQSLIIEFLDFNDCNSFTQKVTAFYKSWEIIFGKNFKMYRVIPL